MHSVPSFARVGALGLGVTLTAVCALLVVSCSSGDSPPPGGGGGAAGSTSTTTSTATSTSTSTGMSMPWSKCDECLATTCAAEEAACDGECKALQACIETVCFNLSAIGNLADEGKCQVKCQNDHADGKTAHTALVYCAESAKCSPPCTFYPQDYDLCRTFMDKGACKDAKQACKDSSDCATYNDCVFACSTLSGCLACDDTPSGLAGRKLLEAYELCISDECIAESWLK